MVLDIDSKLLGIPCPKCGNKISETIKNIKNIKSSTTLTCNSRNCRTKVKIKAGDLQGEIEAIEISIKEIREMLKRLKIQ